MTQALGIDDVAFWILAPLVVIPTIIFYKLAINQAKKSGGLQQKTLTPGAEVALYLDIMFSGSTAKAGNVSKPVLWGLRLCTVLVTVGVIYVIVKAN